MVSEGTPITPLSCDSLTKSINKDPRPKSPIPTDSTVSVPTFSSPAAPPIKFPSGSSSSSMHTSNKSVASPGDPVHSLPVSGFFKPATKLSREADPSWKPPNNPNTTHKRKGVPAKGSAGKRFRSNLGKFANPIKPMKVKTSSPVPLSVKVPSPNNPQIQCGLDKNTSAKFEKTEANEFPAHLNAIVNAMVDGSVKFGGSPLIANNDLSSLRGGHQKDEDNYLSNFVIDSYLKVLAETATCDAETIEWEVFEKGIGSQPAVDLLGAKADLMTKDYVLVQCNPMTSRHWFLLAALPKQKQIVIMDSLQGFSVKPTQKVAVRKMWKLLKEIDPSLDDETTEWNFVSNANGQLPQQENGYDCGVYVCIYARCLLGLSGAAVSSDSIPSFRKQMLLELHRMKVEDKLQPIQEGQYYAVEYQRAFYIGRILRNMNATLTIKFLHSVGAKVFDWPTRDDIDDCSPSWLISGPLEIQGSGPFRFLQLGEVEHVYQYIKRSKRR